MILDSALRPPPVQADKCEVALQIPLLTGQLKEKRLTNCSGVSLYTEKSWIVFCKVKQTAWSCWGDAIECEEQHISYLNLLSKSFSCFQREQHNYTRTQAVSRIPSTTGTLYPLQKSAYSATENHKPRTIQKFLTHSTVNPQAKKWKTPQTASNRI